MIRVNIRSGENTDGFLTASQQEYMSCLDLKHTELEILFFQDEERWKTDMNKVREKAKRV